MFGLNRNRPLRRPLKAYGIVQIDLPLVDVQHARAQQDQHRTSPDIQNITRLLLRFQTDANRPRVDLLMLLCCSESKQNAVYARHNEADG
jgi:hypothetical protein